MAKLTEASISNWFDLASYEEADRHFQEQIQAILDGPNAAEVLGDITMMAGVLAIMCQRSGLLMPPADIMRKDARLLLAVGMVFQARVAERAKGKEVKRDSKGK